MEYRCKREDCVFFYKNNVNCLLSESENFFVIKNKEVYSCLNYITNKKDLSKEAIKSYFK